jgi:hypothetical protein
MPGLDPGILFLWPAKVRRGVAQAAQPQSNAENNPCFLFLSTSYVSQTFDLLIDIVNQIFGPQRSVIPAKAGVTAMG